MSHARAYLDYNATAPLRPESRAAIVAALDVVGNPSSVHAEGRAARALVEGAREKVAALIGARPADIVFTSGATEANAWVMSQGWDVIATAAHEHPSVLASARAASAEMIVLPARGDGTTDLAMLYDRDAWKGATRPLLSLQLANGETGVIQQVGEAIACRPAQGLVHTDASQAVGRIAVDMRALGVDLMSVSAHKIGGPKGVGALVIREGLELSPLIAGGGQESRRRAGTENVAAIAGFGAAAEAALRDLADTTRLQRMRDRLEREVVGITPDAVVIGGGAVRLPNTSSLSLPGQRADTLVIRLDLAGVAVSAGAACSSGKVGASHVLSAMRLPPRIANGAIRISIGHATTDADIEAFLLAWSMMAESRHPAPASEKTDRWARASKTRPRARVLAGEG